MHPALEAVRETTRGTEFEGQIWLVGGAVRDELLGLPHDADFDLVSTKPAGDLVQLLQQRGLGDIPAVVYARFGTAMLRVQGANLEFATTRKESYEPESRKPDVKPATIEEDAKRRDFTVNALLRNLHTDQLTDPLHKGLADLEARILQTPLDPEDTFRDDPLRMLRAVRFRWQLGFQPAGGLYDAISAAADRLQIISGERIRDEFVKMLSRPTAPEALRDLMSTGLIHQFAPEFEAMVGVEQGDFHHLDVWDHTLLVLKNVGCGDLVLSLAALLHDVAKPQTRMLDDQGRTRFFGHETAGAVMSRLILDRLKFSGKTIDAVASLVRNHMRVGAVPTYSDAAARRLVRDLGENLPRLLDLVEADANALKPGVRAVDLVPIRAKIETIASAAQVVRLESPLSGAEIMEITGLTEGTEIGELKSMLTERVLDGSLAPGDKVGARKLIEAK